MAPLESIPVNTVHRQQVESADKHVTGSKPLAGEQYLTLAQRDTLIQDLQLEINTRISRLRGQYQLAATALRSKVENRINRIPKRLWSMTLQQLNDLATQPASPIKRPPASNATSIGKLNTLAVPKLRATGMPSSSARARATPANKAVNTTRPSTTARYRANPTTASVIKKSPVKRTVRSTHPRPANS